MVWLTVTLNMLCIAKSNQRNRTKEEERNKIKLASSFPNESTKKVGIGNLLNDSQ